MILANRFEKTTLKKSVKAVLGEPVHYMPDVLEVL